MSEINGSVWQNKVAAVRVIPYLARQRIKFNKKVSSLLDTTQEGLGLLDDKGDGPHDKGDAEAAQ